MKTNLFEDEFDNGRTPLQLKKSFENSYGTCIAYGDEGIIGTARVISDGVGNAYVVDVWTMSEYRRQGIARKMMEIILSGLKGQHVYLQTDNDMLVFYKKIGFQERPTGMEIIVGDYLKND
jgi:ribosomal protein S18 acetylase RimI-like enzyme